MLRRTFYVTFIPVAVCEFHNELKATWLELTWSCQQCVQMREDCSKRWARSMRTDEQQCLSNEFTVGLTQMTSKHATVYMARVDQ